MKDNINNEIHIGDSVFCYSGYLKHTIQSVIGLRGDYNDSDDSYSYGCGVIFKDSYWLAAENVVSLNALGVNAATIKTDSLVPQSDALGNPLHVGDRVVYRDPMEVYCKVGIVKSLASKSCLLEIKKEYSPKTEYRKKYEELISLTALGIEMIPKRNIFGEIIE